MTKLRAPASFHQAVTRIAGVIGWAAAADAVSRSERTVRSWSDPDTGALPSIEDALILDCAYLAAGAGEAPIHAVYAFRLEACAAPRATGADLAAAAAIAAKEAGEAIASIVLTSQNDTPATRAAAAREAEEAIAAFSAAVRKLIPSATGPPAGP